MRQQRSQAASETVAVAMCCVVTVEVAACCVAKVRLTWVAGRRSGVWVMWRRVTGIEGEADRRTTGQKVTLIGTRSWKRKVSR